MGLSINKIRDIMHGIGEPITKWYGVLVWLPFVLSLMVVFHWIGETDPDLIEEYGVEYAEELMYNGEIRNVIVGVPDYFTFSVIWYAIAIVMMIVATCNWDVNVSEAKITAGQLIDDD